LKKALVVIIMVLGLGAVAFAGPLSGSWFTLLRLDLTTAGDVDLNLLFSELQVDYTVGGWTFTSVSDFVASSTANTGFADQYFIATGTIGAFSGGSFLNFDPTAPSFEKWLTGGKVSIAGVTLYGFFDLEAGGTGWLFGAEGSAGDLTIRAETYFNLQYSLIYAGYTFDDVVGGFADYAYSSCDGTIIADDAFALATQTCSVAWSGFDAELTFPFACISEVVVDISFNCEDGFDYVKFGANDIVLGVDWLTIDDFDIMFTTQTKSVTLDIDIALGGVCVTPYWEVNKNSGGWGITGFELYALALEYTWNGITFKDVTLFDTSGYFLDSSGDIYLMKYKAYYCYVPYDELFEITAESDSCCGGAISFDVKNWFDVGAEEGVTGIFGWEETDISVKVGIGSGFTLGLEAKVTDDNGVERIGVSGLVVW